MAQQTARIDWIDAAGELGALLKESQQVKELAPVYNRKLRQHRSLITIEWDGTPACVPELVGKDRIERGDFKGFFGLFRSKSQAKKAMIALADDYQLCHKKLGLEKNSKGACFRAQIGKCHGVCCGREVELQHALRMSDAFAKLKLQSWPWNGAVGIRETHPEGWQEVHVVENWCYFGSVRSEDELAETTLGRGSPAFDMDTYKLLVKYLIGRRPLDVLPLPGATAISRYGASAPCVG